MLLFALLLTLPYKVVHGASSCGAQNELCFFPYEHTDLGTWVTTTHERAQGCVDLGVGGSHFCSTKAIMDGGEGSYCECTKPYLAIADPDSGEAPPARPTVTTTTTLQQFSDNLFDQSETCADDLAWTGEKGDYFLVTTSIDDGSTVIIPSSNTICGTVLDSTPKTCAQLLALDSGENHISDNFTGTAKVVCPDFDTSTPTTFLTFTLVLELKDETHTLDDDGRQKLTELIERKLKTNFHIGFRFTNVKIAMSSESNHILGKGPAPARRRRVPLAEVIATIEVALDSVEGKTDEALTTLVKDAVTNLKVLFNEGNNGALELGLVTDSVHITTETEAIHPDYCNNANRAKFQGYCIPPTKNRTNWCNTYYKSVECPLEKLTQGSGTGASTLCACENLCADKHECHAYSWDESKDEPADRCHIFPNALGKHVNPDAPDWCEEAGMIYVDDGAHQLYVHAAEQPKSYELDTGSLLAMGMVGGVGSVAAFFGAYMVMSSNG